MTRKASKRDRPAAAGAAGRRRWAYRLVRDTVLWLIPAAALWALLTPSYNRFLEIAGQNLARLIESPDVTRLVPRDEHYALIGRLDFPASREIVGSLRVTDLHFPVIFLVALFLAVPETPWRRRLANLGLALIVMALFHVLMTLFWVEFTYATQLGDWSRERYGAFARNFWGLGKHLLDLPVKLALPFVLWAGFYLDRLLPGGAPAGDR